MRILIVEDEHINQMILGNMLGDIYEVMYAADGIEALEQVKTHKDDLAMVLLDLQMPHMGGMEVLALSFCKEKNGVSTRYSLQTIKTRESDHHHIVIGVRQE